MKRTKQQKAAKQSKNGKAPAVKSPKPVKAVKPAAEPKHTIKAVVIEAFAANPGMTNAELTAKVKAEFPQSAFDAKHASWYRMQAKSGKLTGTKVTIPPRQKAAATAVTAS